MPVVVGVLTETAANETRVALVPEIAAKLKALGSRVLMEHGAGAAAHFPDSLYTDVEFSDAATILASADVILKVQPPSLTEVAAIKKGAVIVGYMQAYARPDLVRALKERGITSFAMELIPRISRAQSMDALSSQASVAGYKAALIAADTLERFLPMLTTAAGTIRPASVLVIGAGVAGLQAIATAKRLGAVVEAYDVRSATKDQIKSLGAKFIETGVSAEGTGGYARELTPEEKAKQQEVLDARIAASDAVISTASVPGRAAPRIISK
ncbi:MAG: transhydrogenase subunit alpha, partial [Gammaproteobacteria bacterium]|nr:transhydrogenase subunit alpha [Gammaproteobacteria bacterium]